MTQEQESELEQALSDIPLQALAKAEPENKNNSKNMLNRVIDDIFFANTGIITPCLVIDSTRQIFSL